MGSIVDQINRAFRDYVTDGIASSGIQDVDKAEARAIGPIIENAIAQVSLGAMVDVTYATRAALNADLAWAAGSVALVYGDSTDANNDLYTKSGASGAGSWTLTSAFHTIISGLAQPFVTAASGHRARAQNAVMQQSWSALAAATGMVAGDRAQVSAADTGTHASLSGDFGASGGQTANSGVFQYSASAPTGWVRVDDLDSTKSGTLLGTVTNSGTANPPTAGTSNGTGTLIDATAFGAAGVLQLWVYAGADGWITPFTCSLNGDNTIKLEQIGVPRAAVGGTVVSFPSFTPDVAANHYPGFVTEQGVISIATASGRNTWTVAGTVPPDNLSSGSSARTIVSNSRMRLYWEVSTGQRGDEIKDIAARTASTFALGTATASVGIIPASDGSASYGAGSLTLVSRQPATFDGVVTAASTHTANSGTGYFAVLERVGANLVPRYIEPNLRNFAAGANDFTDLIMPIRRGQFVAVYTTATVRYGTASGQGGGVWFRSGTPGTVGIGFAPSFQATNAPRLGYTISPLVAGLKAQMDAGDAVLLDLIVGSQITFGSTAANATQGGAALTIFPLSAVTKTGLVTNITFPAAVAGSQVTAVVATKSGNNWTTVSATTLPGATVVGSNSYSGLNIEIAAGQYLALYAPAGTLQWQTGGGVGFDYILGGPNFSNTARTSSTASVTFAMQYTIQTGLMAKLDFVESLNTALAARVSTLENASATPGITARSFDALGITITSAQVMAMPATGQSNSVPFFAAGETSAPITTTQLYSNVMSNGSGGFTGLVSVTTEKNWVTAANFATVTGLRQGWLTDPASQWLSSYTAGVNGASIDPAAGTTMGAGSASVTSLGTQATTLKNAATAAGKSFSVPLVFLTQGETDQLNGMAKATYANHLENWRVSARSTIRGVTGNTDDLIVLISQPVAYLRRTGDGGSGPVLAQFEAAQPTAAQPNPRYHLVGPMYRYPHAADQVHLSRDGVKLHGAYEGRAAAAILAGKKPQSLKPISAEYEGNIVRVRFEVPTLPLVFDSTALGATTTQGIRVVDASGTATITGLSIDKDTVVITCSANLAGPVKARFALDYLGAGRNIDSGASCTLRDSTPDRITISGTSWQMFHCAPMCELTAVNVGV
ncbi:hypothetical protein [Novosphingobium huizhouense]|uniref:hypothetical protein n=1 Tax=Novosphingobium huizhouense TaxID=2866625 RepID=UPI001CD85CCE|nr:hypothetical protein [Novosphingobium huizhouense]